MKNIYPTLASSAFLLTSCGTFDEGIREKDISGVVRIPVEALETVQLTNLAGDVLVSGGFTRDAEGNPVESVLEEFSLIGPVYLGAFPSVEEGHFEYLHPEMGPVLDPTQPGNTYPYGGTTVGRFDYACFEQLRCKVVTGRYDSFKGIVDFFADVLQQPIINPDGQEVTTGDAFQEHCFDTEYVTSDDELSFIDDDPNEDVSPYFKPYFRLNKEGTHYVADVTIPHTLFVEGMTLWGWVDMPSPFYSFTTCDGSDGAGSWHYRYTEQYYKGAGFPDVLNFPGTFIDAGDWIAEPIVLNDPDKDFTIDLNFHFEG